VFPDSVFSTEHNEKLEAIKLAKTLADRREAISEDWGNWS
jgi:hypothetical protein